MYHLHSLGAIANKHQESSVWWWNKSTKRSSQKTII